ncbi:MAG: HD domain-containing phosphohydrolase [Candidatus Latescibacterota bacterium]|nr:HD domain-containing phosphohydrolase [Candidatus Latescibacterota bacterium]
MHDHEDNELEDRLHRLNAIGIALSSKHREIDELLQQILVEARRFTHAEAGTLYLLEGEALTFAFAQNDRLNITTSSSEQPSLPPVPLNKDSVSGYVALTGETLNVADVYDESAHHWEGPKSYDRLMGYRTQSMLVVPMTDHEGLVIGVLQLLNANAKGEGYASFSIQDETLIESLASQAAVAINNVRLIRDMESLFNSFVQVMATAIDERSPYTGGHIRRVAELTMVTADAVNRAEDGPFADSYFSDDELRELHMAAWMHDVGKITTPEWIVDKPTKLTSIVDRIELLQMRFVNMRQRVELLIAKGEINDVEGVRELAAIDEDWNFVERANHPSESVSEEDLDRLRRIAKRTVFINGNEIPCISTEELGHLCIRRGTLTADERLKINDHAAVSIRMLSQIPFTSRLKKVPEIAGAHHEKLDGSGYPLGLSGEEITLQSRILALADIFESLSADDRPYREQPLSRKKVLGILQSMVDGGHIDADLYALFLAEGIYEEFDRIKKATPSVNK